MHQSVRKGGLNVSKVLPFADFQWDGVPAQSYKKETHSWQGVVRHCLIGDGGETTRFHVRYFEVAPGGHTTLEVHRHEHVVVPLRGRGEFLVGEQLEARPIGFGDCVYVAPLDPHQFRNRGPEPFGFLCIVNSERDPARKYRRPVAADTTEAADAPAPDDGPASGDA